MFIISEMNVWLMRIHRLIMLQSLMKLKERGIKFKLLTL
jgi:hypothetical protein